MIGEALGRWVLRRWHRLQREACHDAYFDGDCPKCGNTMQFVKREERCGDAGSVFPGIHFVCYGCGHREWKQAFDRSHHDYPDL